MTSDTTPRRALPARAGRRAGRGLTIAGVVLLVLGLGALGWSAYESFWKPVVDPGVVARGVADLREEWAAPAASGPVRAAPGEPVALLRIPASGQDPGYPVLVGTDPAALAKGVGWYDGTAAAGAVGNFAVAGHGGMAGPFAGLGQLRPGDRIVVETREAVHTYEVTNTPAETTVRETDTWVIQPVPGHPETKPTEALLTLTTTGDLFRTDARMIAFGKLVGTQPK